MGNAARFIAYANMHSVVNSLTPTRGPRSLRKTAHIGVKPLTLRVQQYIWESLMTSDIHCDRFDLRHTVDGHRGQRSA